MKVQPLNAWQRARLERHRREQWHRRLLPALLLLAALTAIGALVFLAKL